MAEWYELAIQVGTLFIACVALATVYYLKKQVKQSEKSIKLAHWPLIYPRIMYTGSFVPMLGFENIGTGSAKEVHLTLKDDDTDEEFEGFHKLAMKHDEPFRTRIELSKHKKVKIKGSYQNILGDEELIEQVFDYEKRKAEEVSSNKK